MHDEMEPEGYGLKWQNHLTEVFNFVRKLRTKNLFSDVILHCDGKNFFAHRVILAASSAFFDRILSSLPNEKSNVVVMAETRPDLLRLILDFIYNGETFIDADLLEDFMEIAERFEIRGLRKKTGESSEEAPDVRQSAEAPAARHSTKKRSPNPSSIPEEVSSPASVVAEDDDRPVLKKLKFIPTVKQEAQHRVLPSPPPLRVVTDTVVRQTPVDLSKIPPLMPGGAQIRPVSKQSEQVTPQQAGPSRIRVICPPIDVSRNEKEHRVELEDRSMKLESEEPQCDENENTEEAIGDDDLQEGSLDGDQSQYDESFNADADHPRSIPPEIAADRGVTPWRPGTQVWRGIDVNVGHPRFFCGICGYSAMKAWNVSTHMRKHTGERPFVCRLCAKGFKQKRHLQKHYESHAKRELEDHLPLLVRCSIVGGEH